MRAQNCLFLGSINLFKLNYQKSLYLCCFSLTFSHDMFRKDPYCFILLAHVLNIVFFEWPAKYSSSLNLLGTNARRNFNDFQYSVAVAIKSRKTLRYKGTLVQNGSKTFRIILLIYFIITCIKNSIFEWVTHFIQMFSFISMISGIMYHFYTH